MQASCAAVFFVTPNYKDEKYLAAEIDYAIHQKREKGERFAITTIVLKDGNGNRGEVPELLRPYVWKEPKNQVEMIEEILKSLPVTTSGVVWR
jgi:hypothetical protein